MGLINSATLCLTNACSYPIGLSIVRASNRGRIGVAVAKRIVSILMSVFFYIYRSMLTSNIPGLILASTDTNRPKSSIMPH